MYKFARTLKKTFPTPFWFSYGMISYRDFGHTYTIDYTKWHFCKEWYSGVRICVIRLELIHNALIRQCLLFFTLKVKKKETSKKLLQIHVIFANYEILHLTPKLKHFDPKIQDYVVLNISGTGKFPYKITVSYSMTYILL